MSEENIRELTDEELEKVTGGSDGPEDFEWQAPHRQSQADGWEFSGTIDVNGQARRIYKSGNKREWK